MQTPQPSRAFKRIEFLVVTKNHELLSASKDVAEHFSFRTEICDSVEMIDSETLFGSSPLMILLSLEETASLQDKLAALRKLRQVFPRSQVVMMVFGIESLEDADLLRAAGAHHLVLLQEIISTGKLFYLAALLVQGTYLPVPVTDLFPSTQLSFNAYHKLLLNQKFLPVIFSGFTFSDKKYRKLEPSKQIYIRREDLGEYRKYIDTYHDRSGNALKKRCRALMMTLMGLYSEIILLMSLEAEAARRELLTAKLAEFIQNSEDLGGYLKNCPDVWNVIAESLDFKFCRLERGPYILAYAICISLKAEIGRLKDIILTALFADLGILDLPSECYKNLQKRGEIHLTPQELECYQNHPMGSLNRAMNREVEMSDELKSNIACTHERNDKKGFPNQVPADKIPVEAKLIFFCELMDRRVRASLEDGIVTHDFVRKQVWEEEKDSLMRFNADFLDKIEKVLIA